jgi:hypothetical protein
MYLIPRANSSENMPMSTRASFAVAKARGADIIAEKNLESGILNHECLSTQDSLNIEL